MSGSSTSGIQIWSKPIPISDTVDALVFDCSPIYSSDYTEKINK
jgi:hypothetical protein